MLPHARQDGLVVQDVQGEILVYDLSRHRAYCLNRAAAAVWQRCDGRTSVAEMAGLVQKELNMPADEELVLFALRRLGSAHLLRERMAQSAPSARYSRREMIRKIGLLGGIAVLLPVVESIVAPTPASAASCVVSCVGQPNNTPCGACNGSQCCNAGLCTSSCLQ